MLLQIIMEFKKIEKSKSLYFFEEKEILLYFLIKYNAHCNNCGSTEVKPERCLRFFINLILISNSKNVDIIFHFLAFPLLYPSCYKNINELPENFIGMGALSEIKRGIKLFYSSLSTQNVDKNISLQHINELFIVMSSSLLILNTSQVQQIEKLYMKICTNVIESNNEELILLIIEAVPHLLNVFKDVENLILNIFKPIFFMSHKTIQEKSMNIVPNILCCLSSDFLNVLKWNNTENKLTIKICCVKCDLKNEDVDNFVKPRFGEDAVGITFQKIQFEPSLSNFLLKPTLTVFTTGTADIKMAALEALPYFSSHVLQFHFASVAKIWIELAGDQNKKVREKFADVVYLTVGHEQENSILSQDTKKDILEIVFNKLLSLTKKSLQFSDYVLQDTLLRTMEEISMMKHETIMVESMTILIYFIMIPTSKYSLLAVNKCFKLAKANEMTTTSIYSQNKKELCKVIVHLSSVNQVLINYTLVNSLEKVSLMLGFYSPKDFLNQESNYLLPFFIAKTIKMPAVTKLIQEMALLMELDVSEMLSCKYGYIFIYIFLEELPKDDFKQCMLFLEKTTGMSGSALRKRNFRIILNELLLNFHEKRDRVILALTILTDEDKENKSNSIPDYLQPHFLGILLYFDVRLISRNSKKEGFLQSLADLFKFMGPKHIMPLRFKIIAMLQTIKYENYPHLICEVWNSFIRSCEIESLGPQLATIFVSMQPLLDHCPRETNAIFKYLIIEKEAYTRDYISDLFFVNNANVDHDVSNVIKNALQPLEDFNLKQKIQAFLKYLSHEAMEVRLQGLKQLKNYLVQSREELDQMILDYNGIDDMIVELIDTLTLGCREKDEALKLACGEVFGELGAIEPSHLPRRYTQETDKSFSFFMNEDSFIINLLNELIRALQTEKNTQNMDRYALAIQEILKDYDISSDQSSSKYYLWEQFPESHKEVMLPLLSSRYMIAQPIVNNNFPVPIYGSNVGASFQSWLYNWTCSLLSSLPNERKQLLTVCLPSMKQSKRILMNFLPHILLHALLEGPDDIGDKSFVEFQTVTNSFTKKRKLDETVLGLRPLKIPGVSVEPQIVTPEEVKQMQCTKVVFLLLDFLDRWLREWQWQKGLEGITNEFYKKIKNFQLRLCKLQLAKCNYHCGEYPRALMYLEDYITENNTEINNHLSFFAEIYAQLDELDGVAGVSALQQNEPSIEQKILALEVSGKLADAITCYERILEPKIHHIQGLVQCYLDLDNVNTALNFVKGAQNNQLEFGNMLLEMQAEPLWRLGEYDELDGLLRKPELIRNKSWGVQVGQALLYLKNGNRDEFKNTLDGLLKSQVESFGAASLEVGAYQHGYSCISKLHALNELRQVENTLSELFLKPNDNTYTKNVMMKLTDEWMLRIKVVQESVRVVEPLLCMRRVSLNLAKKIAEERVPQAIPFLNSLIGEHWLLSAKTARAAGMHQQAYTYTVKAEEYAPPTLFVEKAKLHWLREEHEQALTTLIRGLESFSTGRNFADLTMDET
ncbi:serine/threonine-protein kinase ATR-like, partial [Anoplophora glabripennis]|uniref:serine/threonine-protein kinase ATR-like n=1 Tax=Anoplophora glabripennis TaxID=217634 RepID=UPI0008757AF5